MCFFKKKYLIIFLMAFFASCVHDKDSTKHSIATVRNNQVDTAPADSTVYSSSVDYPYEEIIKNDSIVINKTKFFIFFKRDTIDPYWSDTLAILDNNGNTAYIKAGVIHEYEFSDFNNDGNKDILIHHIANTSGVFDLVLFNPKSYSFIDVEAFYYPAAVNIKNTNYYYSYYGAGCADMNWQSDLFYIENYVAIPLANIQGEGCDGLSDVQGIFINKVINDTNVLYETYPIDTITKLDGYKWEFIEKYWTKNYRKFVN